MRLFAYVYTWMVVGVCKFMCVVEMSMSSAYVMSCVCLYEVPMLLSLFGLGISMMLASFHT